MIEMLRKHEAGDCKEPNEEREAEKNTNWIWPRTGY